MSLPSESLATSLPNILMQLQKRFGLDICGEGGEYESFVLDSIIFSKQIIIDSSHILLDSEDSSVGNLIIDSYHMEK
eukprot:gene13750-29243_t